MQSQRAQCVSGTLEIRQVYLPTTSQAPPCDYCAHVHCDDDAQTIYLAALVNMPRNVSGFFMFTRAYHAKLLRKIIGVLYKYRVELKATNDKKGKIGKRTGNGHCI